MNKAIRWTDMPRLLFFAGAIFWLAACSSKSRTDNYKEIPPRLSIFQGITTETTTRISVLRHKSQSFEYQISGDGRFKVPTLDIRSVGQGEDEWIVDQLSIVSLEPQTTYRLKVFDSKKKLIDERAFSSLEISNREVRFVVASCLDEEHPRQEKMWHLAFDLKPDFLVLLGDNVYATRNPNLFPDSAQNLWMRHVEARKKTQLYFMDRLIPAFSMWDDHDFGQNNGGAAFEHKEVSQRIFQSFFVNHPSSLSVYSFGPGMSYRFDGMGHRFIFLDSRTFRGSVEHLGAPQLDWFRQQVGPGLISPVWVFKGDQFFGAYHEFESYEGNHPGEFRSFKEILGGVVKPFTLVSGDRHLFELSKLDSVGFPNRFEITTSPIHAITYDNPWSKTPNPLQIKGIASKENFALIRAHSLTTDLSLGVSVYGAEGVLYEQNFLIKSENQSLDP